MNYIALADPAMPGTCDLQFRIFRKILDVPVETGISRFVSRAPKEGRFAIVTDVGRGMRWTPSPWQTSRVWADGEVVWSRYPDADINLAMMLRITPGTVARKPGSPRRSRSKPLKPLRGECRMFRRNRGD